MRHAIHAMALAALLTSPALAATTYDTTLLPSPLDDGTRANVTGRGTVSATLDGSQLTVSGSFAGLATPATEAHLSLGAAIGVPGTAVQSLTVTQAASGNISGAVRLTGAQSAAFRTGRLYVQIDSQKAGAPYGNLWGWLMPQHARAAIDMPQAGHGFLPQLDTPKK